MLRIDWAAWFRDTTRLDLSRFCGPDLLDAATLRAATPLPRRALMSK